MKRSWGTSLLVGSLVVLFAALGVMQYHWLRQISDANTEKERERVSEQTKRFAADFNRELQNAYFNLQADAETWRTGNWLEFNERFDFWRSNTQYPDLISGIYFVNKETGAVSKYDFATKSFGPASSPDGEAEAAIVRSAEIVRQVDIPSMTMFLPIIDPPMRLSRLVEGRPLNVVETQSNKTVLKMPPRYGYLAIQLNRSVIDDQLVPALKAKYFPDNDYTIATFDGDAPDSDASAKLYEMRPENLIMFSNRDAVPRSTASSSIVLNSHVETVHGQWSGPNGGEASKYEIKIQSDQKPRTQVFTATAAVDDAGATRLVATHTSGSIDAFMNGKLRRDLAVGFSLLLLIAAAVLSIIVSSMRTRYAAQRQIDFVSSVSHEFRTPLAVIKSAGENLADGVTRDASQVNNYGELIKSEGNKLNAMVEQILEFAGANSGRQKLKRESTLVADLVNSAIDECRPIAEDRGFEIETDIAEDLPIVNVDRSAMSQAIQNLVTNSIKYSNGKKWLRVSASNGEGKVKIVVEDRGIGISKSDLKQIFEPFFRSKDVVDAQIHGNGLGLSLVKKTLDAHGGEVTAKSELGKGSKFTIELKA